MQPLHSGGYQKGELTKNTCWSTCCKAWPIAVLLIVFVASFSCGIASMSIPWEDHGNQSIWKMASMNCDIARPLPSCPSAGVNETENVTENVTLSGTGISCTTASSTAMARICAFIAITVSVLGFFLVNFVSPLPGAINVTSCILFRDSQTVCVGLVLVAAVSLSTIFVCIDSNDDDSWLRGIEIVGFGIVMSDWPMWLYVQSAETDVTLPLLKDGNEQMSTEMRDWLPNFSKKAHSLPAYNLATPYTHWQFLTVLFWAMWLSYLVFATIRFEVSETFRSSGLVLQLIPAIAIGVLFGRICSSMAGSAPRGRGERTHI
jgi:hypothetical protein